MKIKQLAAMCRDSGALVLIDRCTKDGDCYEQWISNRYAMYPLEGMPYMELEHITRLFELTDKQMDSMVLRHEHIIPTGIDISDSAEGELCTRLVQISIVVSGAKLLPVETDKGICYIDNKYYAPIKDADNNCEIWERRMPNGQEYFAIKTGLMCAGVVMPWSAMDTHLCDLLREVLEGTEQRLRRKSLENFGVSPEHIDPETGEVAG